ncbi:MAG TPA: AMP-binding protein [Pseudonocardia sp.]|jgi:acyl-CoA synthetase (AMP-forming)/AMP-acid ligase II|nr:AMP-binding protein [Pseudonocardia sp.]
MPGPVIADLFHKSRLSRGEPGRTALVDRDVRLSYAELDERSDRLAAGLLAHGLAVGDRVAILSHNRVDYVVTFLALAKAGAISVPVNYLLRGPEIRYHLEDSGATWTFVERQFLNVLRPLVADLPGHRVVVFDGATEDGELGFEELLAKGASGAVLPEVEPSAVALLQYTSGTTGRPKGATHTQAGVVLNSVSQVMDMPIRHDDVYLCMPALCWAAGLHSGLLAWMQRGATVVLHPSGGFDPDAACALVEAERVTAMIMVPAVLRVVLDSGALQRHDVGSLRFLLVGGEPVPVESLDRLERALPSVEVVQAYGQSEFPTIMATLDPRYGRTRAGSTGKALGLTELRVIDEAGADVAAGVHGDIICRSPATMRGYWNKPDETAASIVDGWLRTGDRGWVDDDGFLYIAGRSKDMIISGGLNVYPAEIERVLGEHPGVKECAATGVQDERLGEVGCAWVVLHEGTSVTEDELTALCREHLAGYKVPRHWVVCDEPLPRTASGKVQKFLLKR